MTDWVRQVLERYGQDVTVDTADGERTVRAFLQPMTERDERARSDVTSIGWVDGRLWLYLGQTALEEGEALAWEATRFRVRSCRPYYIGNALSHYWAALEQEREAAELVREICRYKMYFGDKGGVTVSGGEPLMQPAFVGELFSLLHGEGIHTALDTSGVWVDWDGACQVLEHTDLILGDLKFATPEEYRLHCKADMEKPLAFYRLAEERGIPLWVRHVVVPGLNDSLEDMGKIKVLAESFSNLEKIEWLPFHNLCVEKYQSMGIPFPLAGTDNMDEEALQRLVDSL